VLRRSSGLSYADDLAAAWPNHEQVRVRQRVAEFGCELRLRGMVKTPWTLWPAADDLMDTGQPIASRG
jgi:hypothetical protein